MPLTSLFFQLNAVTDAIFPVKRRQRHFFFRFNAVNAAIFPVKRRQRQNFPVQRC